MPFRVGTGRTHLTSQGYTPAAALREPSRLFNVKEPSLQAHGYLTASGHGEWWT